MDKIIIKNESKASDKLVTERAARLLDKRYKTKLMTCTYIDDTICIYKELPSGTKVFRFIDGEE